MNYDQALVTLNLENLKSRRERLAKKFALSCLKIPEMSNLFKKQRGKTYELRDTEKFNVNFAHSQRYYKSSVPTLQRMLNK